MIDWPNTTAIQRAMTWNRSQQQRAERDASHARHVPRSATRRVYRGGRAHTVQLTLDEYRASRAADAARHAANIESLGVRL